MKTYPYRAFANNARFFFEYLKFSYSHIYANTTAKETHKITKIIGIQMGAVTHHQDQAIIPVNFNTRKTRNNRVVWSDMSTFIFYQPHSGYTK